MKKKLKTLLLAFLAILLVVLWVLLRGKPSEVPADQEIVISKVVLSSEPLNESHIEMQNPAEKKTPQVSLDLILGNFDPAFHEQFVRIEDRYASRSGMYMHREAYEAFKEMHKAAAAEGVHLVIVSAMRNFDHQCRIWNNKWNGQQVLEGNIRATDIEDPVERAREILRFSAMPGTSRHHWGTDIDLNSLVNNYFESVQGKKVYEWLQANGSDFGFCQPYTARDAQRPEGYEEEKWHWSFLPLAAKFLSAFEASVQYDHLKGFDGWETAAELNVIENYVLGINEKCKMKN